ncbi:uncharacterized protein LAESUDRAFT_701135 [Laetiporus sulphureus 93-53]|uniref:DNA replication regulator SLD2 n=1 Tax=Laetiporus sulphureus 93-53 TaxID=1314785 RepID=A0A165DXG7_9APHY|nr:uncharacterized protein LAESUDRAFT_701135 [Laetiporus sulphureus 93-53]KZT05824.1 hypothetical protein LAESUDRAFT_701135 [Laetiporus sulphureus 93-53]
MDLASLRAEIKAWEREFRSKYTRDPTIQEIKDRPDIAAKYKLYKSLSKSSSSNGTQSSSSRHEIPSGSQSRQAIHASTSSLLPKARAVRVDPPLQTSNPFSPVKKKYKYLNEHVLLTNGPPDLAQYPPRPDPFATPTKPKAHTKTKISAPQRSPSPDPFPLIELTQPRQPPPADPHTPSVKSAVTRARKRLRGEPVSPSPVKEKRVRVGSQSALKFSSTLLDSDEDEIDIPDQSAEDAEETSLEATPMKPPPGDKAFCVLFDEVLPSPQNTSRQPRTRSLSRNKCTISKLHLFGVRRSPSQALSPSSPEDEENFWATSSSRNGRMTSRNGFMAAKTTDTHQPRRLNEAAKTGIPRAVLPGKDDLWSDVPSIGRPTAKGKPSATSNGKTTLDDRMSPAVKRRHPGNEPEAYIGTSNVNDDSNSQRIPLVPPSPPPAESSSQSFLGNAKDKGKGKAAAAFSRKKAKLLEQVGGEESDDDSTEEDKHVKVVERARSSHRLPSAAFVDELDDPEFQWPAQPVHPPDSPPLDSLDVEAGKTEVRLPDELRRILALSPRRDSVQEEQRLVNGLLYGRRETHYDVKRGEIWEVGEISDGFDGVDEEEEDWEGEPVPWEVAEL